MADRIDNEIELIEEAWICGFISKEDMEEQIDEAVYWATAHSQEVMEKEQRDEMAWQYIGFHGDDEERILL